MRITMSEPGHPDGLHLVIHADPKEAALVRRVLEDEVVRDDEVALKTEPVTIDGVRHWRYRMHKRWLDTTLLAFPTADLSPAIQRRMRKAEEKRLGDMPVPTLRLRKVMKPRALRELTDYQRIGIDKIQRRQIHLLNDEMGLGKTRQALAAAIKKRWFPMLVVCPNNAKYEWERQAIRDFYGARVCVVDAREQTKAHRQALVQATLNGDYDICIVNTEVLRAKPIHEDDDRYAPIIGLDFSNPALFSDRWRFIVVDEHHRLKNPRAQATLGFYALRGYRWLNMSGTPLMNAPEDVYVVLHKLWPQDFPQDYDTFKASLVISKPSATEERVVAYRPQAMGELRDYLQNVSLRRRRDQVLSQLPPVFHVPKIVPMTEEQMELYAEIKEEFQLRMENGDIKTIVSALAQITRLKQACFSPELYGGSKVSGKLEELQQDVETLVASKEKAIIFSQWSKATRIIQRELERYNPAYVDGTIKPRDRQVQQDMFMQDPSCKVYVGTIGANKEAINLGVASYVIFTDVDWAPTAKDQAVGRSAAGGLRGLHVAKGTKVHVLEYQAEGTIEPHLALFQQQKRQVIGRVQDRDGGAAVEKITVSDLKKLLSSV